jgi:HlyD family secretion protein
MGEEQEIFRRQSLERLSSPERLDQALKLVKPQQWLFVLTLAAGLVLLGVWSVLGRIPVTAQGVAVLARPKQVVGLQSPADGRIAVIHVREGQRVAEQALLAELDLPDLKKEIELQQKKLDLTHEHGQELEKLEHDLAQQEKRLIGEVQAILRARKDKLHGTADKLRTDSQAYIEKQRENLSAATQRTELLRQANDELRSDYQLLQREKLVSKEVVTDFRSRVIDSELRMAELEVQKQALALNETEALEAYTDRVDRIEDVETQLKDLELRLAEIDRRLEENSLRRHDGEALLRLEIEFLQERLQRESRVLSVFAGQVLEFTAAIGQQVALGQQLGKLEIESSGSPLMALAYFAVEEGKKVRGGQRINVFPTIFERERFGGIVGQVARVSDYPVTVEAAASQIGDLEIARNLLGGVGRIEVQAELGRDPSAPSGYQWTSGRGPSDPPITAGTTALVRVTVEELRPISFLLPMLRSLGE